MKVLEQYDRSEASLDDAIRHYRGEGGPEELIHLAEDENLRGLALYVLSELGSPASTVWKKVIPFVADADTRTSYSALDLVHAYAGDQDYEYIYKSVILADLSKPQIFAKVCRLLSLLGQWSTRQLFLCATLNQDTKHALGACVLAFADDEQTILSAFESEDSVLRVYLCALVFRDFSKGPLRMCLPDMVREDLELLEKAGNARA